MYTLPQLDYAYGALEPHMDAQTLEIHHSKHHQAYVNGLNKALTDAQYEAPASIENLLHNLACVPQTIRDAVRFNGGGHANHAFFWKLLTSQGQNAPIGDLQGAIQKTFGSFDAFKEKFAAAGVGRWGSGWAWLFMKPDGNLAIASTAQHDSPWMRGFVECEGMPILVVDVWEHAYYLKFQNKRADFIATYWNLINWQQAEINYQNASKSIRQYYKR